MEMYLFTSNHYMYKTSAKWRTVEDKLKEHLKRKLIGLWKCIYLPVTITCTRPVLSREQLKTSSRSTLKESLLDYDE